MSDSVKNPPNSSIFDDGLSFLTKDYYAPGAKNSRKINRLGMSSWPYFRVVLRAALRVRDLWSAINKTV